MGVMVVNFEGTNMESSNARATKTERKVVEKNRRNQMKTLYSKLNSLLPDQSSKEAQPLPDQIDEAINYIKSLEEKLKKFKEKKEILAGCNKKRSYACTCDHPSASSSGPKAPQLKIQETGPALEIVLVTGLDNQFLFYEIVRILHDEGVEVASANLQVLGDSIFHVVHAQIKQSAFGFGAARVIERLNKFVNGSTSEIELDSELWDYQIQSDLAWEL